MVSPRGVRPPPIPCPPAPSPEVQVHGGVVLAGAHQLEAHRPRQVVVHAAPQPRPLARVWQRHVQLRGGEGEGKNGGCRA